MKSQKGFTLIEVLVVIAILGILAAIIVPNVTGYLKSADVSAANTESHMVQNAVYAYMADNKGALPPKDASGNLDISKIQEFISEQPKAEYTFDANGKVSGVAGSYGSLVWNSSGGQWEK